MTDAVNLAAKLATFSEYWQPRTVAQLNEYDVEEVHLLLLEPTGTPNTGDVTTAALRRVM